MPNRIALSTLKELAAKHGLETVGFCSVEPLEGKEALGAWQKQGFSGEMRYMQRDVELLSDPRALLAQALTAVVFALQYEGLSEAPFKVGFGRVARYAWGRDYHTVLREKMDRFLATCALVVGEIKAKVFSDAVPLMERPLARRAGLGFVGKNTMLIRPREGSFFFLAEILWDVEIDGPALPIIEQDCGSCRRCLDRCPTKAIVDDYTIDARRCISYLNIEKRGMLSIDEREMLGEWIFGCDECQEVCPFNHTVQKNKEPPAIAEFSAQNGVGPLISLKSVLDVRSNCEFSRRFGDTALMRTKREGLLRNAAVVAANTKAEFMLPDIILAFTQDSSPVVRAHALWSIVKLYRECGALALDGLKIYLDRGIKDFAKEVRDEALALQQLL